MGLAETAELAVRISLKDGLSTGLTKANSSLGKFERGMGRAGKGAGQLAGGVLKAGAVMAGVAVTGFALATKTAIDFDDAFGAVRKNVEGSKGELQGLNDELHALATRIPVSYTDLAAIAAEAGALGVPTKSVAKFTETIARLSASTQGLSVEAAAEAFGKFRNVLKLTDDDITRAASSLIALGKAGASSEGDIIETAKRFGAAGHQAGLSAAQVLGFASAIASLGVEPEAAGSSLSRMFNNITKYIGTGNKKIVAFAQTAGVSVKAFTKLFAHDATGAVEEFLVGLSKLDKFQASKVLKEAGITNVRDINAVLLLSQNVGELKRQLNLSSDAFKENTELATTSATRFDTLKNKITVLKQNFLEAGYNISEGFLPALGRAADKLTKFLQLPENKNELRKIGEDLGRTLDKIDFGKLLSAAKGAVKVLSPMLDALLALAKVLDALPAEVKGAGAALLVANKVSGGAIGAGLGNIVGGLGETLARSLASKIPLFGSAFVQPVFVTNMGVGGMGGGIPGGGGGIPAIIPVVALAAGVVEAVREANAFRDERAGIQAQGGLTNGEALAVQMSKMTEAQRAMAMRQGAGLVLQREGLTYAQALAQAQGKTNSILAKGSPAINGSTGFTTGSGGSSKSNDQLIAANKITGKLDTLAVRFERATLAGNDKWARIMQTRLTALKAQVATSGAHTGIQVNALGFVVSRTGTGTTAAVHALTGTAAAKLAAANVKLDAIRHKRSSFTARTTVNVNTSVSIREMQKQARISSRVARTTSLSAS